jgi:hypothetical protein
MTEKSHISIAAFVSENERAAVRLAGDHITRSLSQAAAVPWTCECVFSSDIETLPQRKDADIIMTSLLPELEKIDEPWPQAEQRLRKAYTALVEPGIPVFICTILRHMDRSAEPEDANARLIRIRRLDLLAAEISRETGAFVIDIDRVLADIGARRFQTDYRLTGNAAAEMAGHFIALTLIDNACDAFVAFEVQDAAKTILSSCRPAIAAGDRAMPDVTLKKDLVSLGKGRRKQIVSVVAYTVEDNYAGWLVRQVLLGAIGPGEAITRLFHAVRRRGFWESAVLLASGLSRQISRNK